MPVHALFDRGRRKEMQEALRNGDAAKLLARQKPAEEPRGLRLVRSGQMLPPGMKVTLGGCDFRFMGTEDDCAIVRREGKGDSRAEIFRLKAGDRKAAFHGAESGPENYIIEAKEIRDHSGQMIMTVTVEQVFSE